MLPWSPLRRPCAEPDYRVAGPRQFSLEGPYDVFHDVIVCKIYVFADSQPSRFLFQ